MPVPALSWRKVVGLRPPNRSKHSPPGMRTRGLRCVPPPPSRRAARRPGPSRAPNAPSVRQPLSAPPLCRTSYPDRNQPVDVVGFDSGPSGHLLAPFFDHGRPDPRCRSRHGARPGVKRLAANSRRDRPKSHCASRRRARFDRSGGIAGYLRTFPIMTRMSSAAVRSDLRNLTARERRAGRRFPFDHRPVWFNVCFGLLGKRFDYPDILRRRRTRSSNGFSSGRSLILLWWTFMLSGLLLIAGAVLSGRCSGSGASFWWPRPSVSSPAWCRCLGSSDGCI